MINSCSRIIEEAGMKPASSDLNKFFMTIEERLPLLLLS